MNKIISYLTLRKLIGVSAILIAPLCILGGYIFSNIFLHSISAYYNSNMRDLIVSILSITAVFLLIYKGYDLKDNIISSITGISALGIAYFPSDSNTPYYGIFQIEPEISGIIHLVFSIIFFISMAYMSYFQFTKNPNKINKNMIYKTGGLLLFGLSVFLIICNIFHIFYFLIFIESVMLSIFGILWIIKSQS